jgi:hypothetical protein
LLQKPTALNNYLDISTPVPYDADCYTKLFYALVAPSMEGKTQTAFTFKELKPLYFVFIKSGMNTQKIYSNFTELSRMLKNLALKTCEI